MEATAIVLHPAEALIAELLELAIVLSRGEGPRSL